MPLLYPVKRVFRSWSLFAALFIGIFLASTFFASINIKANLAAEQALEQQLSGLVTDMEFNAYLNITNVAFARENISSIDGVKKVDVVARFSLPISLSSDNYTTTQYTSMASMPNSSRIYDEWLNKPVEGIKENETYIVEGTPLAKKVAVGDSISTVIEFPTPKWDNRTTVYINLTVAGFAQLTEVGYSLLSGSTFYISPLAPMEAGEIYHYRQDMLIISWENTLEKLWANAPNGTTSTTFSIYVDRDKLLSPWDTQASAKNLQTVADKIQNSILAHFEAHGYVNNMIGFALTNFQYNFSGTLFNLVLVSLPVFFVAWYLGATVSDVSFNMRRREIGLLSTKGLSSGQIQRLFLTEALLVGFIGGAFGVVGGLILNQVLTGNFDWNKLFSTKMFNPYMIIFTIGFSVVLSLFSVFRSARKAAKMPTVEALRDYIPIEVEKTYKKRWPWIAFILGTYKITAYVVNLNVSQLIAELAFSGNFFVVLLLTPFAIIDQLLNYIAPLLFFWGITKLLIQTSLKFQQLTTRVSVIMGDLTALASKNVRRKPARLAAVAFLIAFIIGYGVQVTAQLASEQDYAVRQVKYQVGADVTVSVINATKATNITESILVNITGIKNATIEYTLRQNNAGTVVKTVDPASWLETAYYEEEWFSGSDVKQIFDELKADNMTIILERRLANQYNLKVGDSIGIDFPSGPRKLRIVGFFGPEPAESSGGILRAAYTVPTWSYAPRDLFNMSSPYSDAYKLESFETKIMLKLEEGVNGTAIAEQIRGLDLEIYGVDSIDEQWRRSQQMSNIYTYSSLQVADTQRLGLVFVVLAASVGTALISIVSLIERRREATLMSVRGLSYGQLVWLFLTENIAAITFSIALGISVGLIIVYGNINSANAAISTLVKRRLVLSQDFMITIASYITVIYVAAIGSILILARQYVTKLERMIRLR
ncbi:MAG: FtsX-like permease family protein [Candidatus Bathyarchaeia archaeon]